jgi:hypothetical protein
VSVAKFEVRRLAHVLGPLVLCYFQDPQARGAFGYSMSVLVSWLDWAYLMNPRRSKYMLICHMIIRCRGSTGLVQAFPLKHCYSSNLGRSWLSYIWLLAGAHRYIILNIWRMDPGDLAGLVLLL